MKFIYISLFTLLGVCLHAQVGIGTTAPNTNSILELNSGTKGFLPTRVNLSSTTAASPLLAHTQGIIVYNLASVNDVKPGLYVNSGTSWELIITDFPVLKAAMYSTVSQTLASGSTNTAAAAIIFDKIDINDGNYNTITRTYTVPADGYYEISFSARITTNPILLGTTSVVFYLEIDDILFDIFTRTQAATYTDNVMHTRIEKLTAGTTIKPSVVVCNCGATAPSYTISNARLAIQQVKK